MTKADKRIRKMRQNPKNVRFDDMDAVLLALGFQKRQRGSHAVYTLNQWRITIPARKPFILPVYVKELLGLLDEILGSE